LADVWSRADEAVRVAAVRTMADLADDRIELNFGRALRLALRDGSAVVRQLAVAALWEDERSDLLAELLRMVRSDPSDDVRAEAARGLGGFADRSVRDGSAADARAVRDALVAIAADEGSAFLLRRRAIEAVGAFGQEPAVRAIVQAAYESDEQDFQAGALTAMGRSQDSRWLPIVAAELGSAEPELRFEAARACGAIGDDSVVPELAELTGDADAEVRYAAVAALGQIGGRAAVRVLRALAEGASPYDAELIEAALEEALVGSDFFQGAS